MATLVNATITGTSNTVLLPIGTTAQRPPATEPGMFRYNSDSFVPEFTSQDLSWQPFYPPGSIIMFGGSAAPDGWLKANGAAVSRTVYAALFQQVGTTWGAGNGSTTFNLPDLRGEFIRSWDDGRGADSGRGFGSFQNEDWKGFYQSNGGSNTFSYTHGEVYMGKTIFSTFAGAPGMFSGRWQAPAAAIGTAWDSSPIRPRNRAALACIKF